MNPDLQTFLQAWTLALATTAAAPVTYALPRARRRASSGITHFITADAAKVGALVPSLAGYSHGCYWYYPYPAS